MKLYHGSTVKIDTILLDKSKPYKDFGKAILPFSRKNTSRRIGRIKSCLSWWQCCNKRI